MTSPATPSKSLENLMGPSKDRSDYTKQSTLGDGNCAFNAFTLGLYHLLSSEGFNPKQPTQFNAILNPILSKQPIIKNWSSLITTIQNPARLRPEITSETSPWQKMFIPTHPDVQKSDLIRLQKIVAPIMRELAAELVHKKEGTERTESGLLSNLHTSCEWVLKSSFGIKTTNPQDDILLPHRFIREKFDEFVPLLREKAKEKVQEKRKNSTRYSIWSFFRPKTAIKEVLEEMTQRSDLLDQESTDLGSITLRTALNGWWQREGLRTFCDEMKKPGKWAGDIELSALADFFGLNIRVFKQSSLRSSWSLPLIGEETGRHTMTLHNSGRHWRFMKPKPKPQEEPAQRKSNWRLFSLFRLRPKKGPVNPDEVKLNQIFEP